MGSKTAVECHRQMSSVDTHLVYLVLVWPQRRRKSKPRAQKEMAQTLDPKGTAHVLGGFAYVFLISYGSILICSYPLVVLGKAPCCLETFRNSRMIKVNVQRVPTCSNRLTPVGTASQCLCHRCKRRQQPICFGDPALLVSLFFPAHVCHVANKIQWYPQTPQDLPVRQWLRAGNCPYFQKKGVNGVHIPKIWKV